MSPLWIGAALAAALLVTGMTAVFLSHLMSAAVRSLFTAAGYDAVQGSFGASITATNATPDTTFISGSFPEQPISSTGSLTFTEIAGNVTFTAGPSGPIKPDITIS